jgi:excinuclease ABC subunit A
VVVDRIVVRSDIADPACRQPSRPALKLADGLAIAEFADKPLPTRKPAGGSQQVADPERMSVLREIRLPGIRLHHPEIEPRLFSFNNPFGACPTCDGLGTELPLTRR